MPRFKLMLIAVTAGLLVVACSSHPQGTASKTHSPSVAVQTSSTAPAPSPTPTQPATAGLTGTWSGQYSGTYSGTFTVTWVQSGSKLKGHITISNPPDTLPINGNVHGNTITFGTVGSLAITYSGTVSGNAMSGTYQVQGNGGGPWSASKKS